MGNRKGATFFFLLLLAAGGCATGAGFYRAGQQAYASGQLVEARAAYLEAVEAEPTNGKYRVALKEVTRELLAELDAQAKAAEKAGEWLRASRSWKQAAEIEPANDEYAVRRDLSLLKSQNLDPDGWYRGVAEVAAKHPSHEIVQRSLEKAKRQAYSFHTGKAKREIGLRHHRKALEHLQRAQKIEPELPGFEPAVVERTRALALVEEGDELLANNDPVNAFERYQRAHEIRPTKRTRRKLQRARSRAKSIIDNLQAARRYAATGRYAKAIQHYARVVRSPGAPPEASKELAELEQKLVADLAANARNDVEQGNMRRAHQRLAQALEHVEGDRAARAAAKAGLDRIERGEPASGLKDVENAKLPESAKPVLQGVEVFAFAVAKAKLVQAERLAKKDPKAARALIAELRPFERDLPELQKLERTLQIGSFTAQLDLALEAANRGDDRGAATLLMKALKMSNAPRNIVDPVREGCEQLALGRYADAERAFLVVEQRAPKSRLANWGLEISRLRRAAAEKRALNALKKNARQEARSVALLEASVGLEPESPHVQAAREVLLTRLEASVTDARAAELLEYAARLSAMGPAARAAVTEGAKHLGSGAYQDSERAFAIAHDRAPQAVVATAGRRFSTARLQKRDAQAEAEAQRKTAVIERRLEAAQKAVARGRLEEALSIYEALSKTPGAPAMDARITETRQQLVTRACAKADQAVQRGRIQPARQALEQALAHVVLPDRQRTAAAAALDAIAVGAPATGLEKLKGTGLSAESPVGATARRLAELVATKKLEEATRAAEKDPDRAAKILGELTPFETKMPAVAVLKKKLAVDVFTAKLDRVTVAAKAGNGAEAGRALRAIVEETRAPAALEQRVLDGCGHLEARRWLEAEKSFVAALEAAPESKMADYALDAARILRRDSEQKALGVIKRGKGDLDQALTRLAAARRIDPENPVRAEAERLLTQRLERGRRASDQDAAALIEQVARISSIPEGVEENLRRGAKSLAAGRHDEAAAAFEAALARAPDLSAAQIGLGRARAGLADAVANGSVPVETEATAAILAGLLKKRPDDAELLEVLSKLLERLKLSADAPAAARYLRLAVIASNPEGPLLVKLQEGTAALSKSDLAAAVTLLGAAVEIDPANDTARAGYEAAKAAREADIVRRIVAEAKRGGRDRVKRALEEKLQDGRRVIDLLLEEAGRLAGLGRDGDAAGILRAANASTAPGPAKNAIAKAADLLEAGRYQEIEKVLDPHSEESEIAEATEKIAFTRHIQRLLAGVSKLASLEDLEGGAKAAAEIFAIDPRDSDVKRALRAVYGHAEEAAASKNTSELVRALSAAAVVLGQTDLLGGPIRMLESGQKDQAYDALQRIGSEYAEEDEDAIEEAAERKAIVEFTKRGRAALAKL